jgi:tetraacyldisaccharide 4'-kinase
LEPKEEKSIHERPVLPSVAIAQALERGTVHGPVSRWLAKIWAAASRRSLVRPLRWPDHVRVIAVGGATLGGSGKTPLAIACAAELSAAGASVALVGHAYGARPMRARIVRPSDPVDDVGDEALVAACALAPTGARVVVAPRRQDAVALGARIADVLVLDGVAQTSPERATVSLLAVDADEPWGRAAALPPCGDLRAPVAALLGSCDRIVAVCDCGVDANAADDPRIHTSKVVVDDCHACVRSRGAWIGDTLLKWDELSRMRLGLVCALGRADRLLRFLARRGVAPSLVVRGPDHGPVSIRPSDVQAWLATPKCRLHVTSTCAAPVATLDHALVLGEGLRRELFAVGVPRKTKTSSGGPGAPTLEPRCAPRRAEASCAEARMTTLERSRRLDRGWPGQYAEKLVRTLEKGAAGAPCTSRLGGRP